MESDIQEAIYLFEMKGDFEGAINLLEKIAKDGDEIDKSQAYFCLGKIQELSDNRQSANFYYKQSLSSANETKLAYWLAEREAITSNQAEQLLQKHLPLPSPVKKTFGNNPTYLQLQNGNVMKISSAGLQNVATNLPDEGDVYQINTQGIWYKIANEDSLRFTSFHSNKQNRSYPIANIFGFLEQNDQVIIQEGNEISLIDKKGAKISISEKYNNCTIEAYYSPTHNYILNCPDNALHFISSENGEESKVIYSFDNIIKVLISKNLVYTVSGNVLSCYNPKTMNHPIWKSNIGNMESLIPFENNIVLLESSGRVSLFDKFTGFIKASILSESNLVSPLAKGTLGLFSEEGSIISVDTLLRPLWIFNFTKSIERPPIQTEDAIYLDFGESSLQTISPRYYGKKPVLSSLLAKKASQLVEDEQWDSLSIILDSLFKVEPGNTEGWFYKALLMENRNANEKTKQMVWAEAVRLSSSNPQTSPTILSQYSKAIGAKFVSQLPISPKTRYPQFFGNKKNLYTIDPAAEQLFCINPENGEIRWTRYVGKLYNNPVIDNDENILAIATKYDLFLYELNKTSSPKTIQMPGKAFNIKVFDDAIYVITWNGFLQKISRSELKSLWSRKIFSVPFLMAKGKDKLYLCNLDGNLVTADDNSGFIKEGSSKRISSNISHMELMDSTLIFATGNNKILIHNLNHPENTPLQILTDSPVSSMQIVTNRYSSKFLVNLANQAILLYSEAGAPLWKYQGKNSVFVRPFIQNENIWIDQGSEIISLDLKDGKIKTRFSIPGGAGTPFVVNNTLFTASPKRILYGFTL